jgi:hypothetical protein
MVDLRENPIELLFVDLRRRVVVDVADRPEQRQQTFVPVRTNNVKRRDDSDVSLLRSDFALENEKHLVSSGFLRCGCAVRRRRHLTCCR